MNVKLKPRRAPAACGLLILCLMLLTCGSCDKPAEEEAGSGATTESGQPATDSAETSGELSPRDEFLAAARRIENSENPFHGLAQIDRLRGLQREAQPETAEAIQVQFTLIAEMMRIGDLRGALSYQKGIDHWLSQQTFDMNNEESKNMLRHIHWMRGMAYLRQAEVQTWVENHGAHSAILPLHAEASAPDNEAALESMKSFEEFLKIDQSNITARWILNIAAMLAGKYPQGVPAGMQVPPSSFRSSKDIGSFENAAPRLGLAVSNQCGAAITEDFDNDGFVDIVTTDIGPDKPVAYFRNKGDGSFEDRSQSSGLADQLAAVNAVAADYDNDGFTDLLLLRGAWLEDYGQLRNSLMHNNGDGTFSDVTRDAGLAETTYPTLAACWADFDNDGQLDLYIANESPEEMGEDDTANAPSYPSQLYHNQGGKFTEIGEKAGVANHSFARGVAAGDYDNDGDMDLYVSNIGPNRLYRNNGDMTFTDVAEELKVTQPDKNSFAPWFFDYNNDGWLDIFVPAYDALVADVAVDLSGKPNPNTPPSLYKNNGDGTFSDVAKQSGLDHSYLPLGGNFGDFNNDGWLDIFLSTGDPQYETLMPKVALLNENGTKFNDISFTSGMASIQKGSGVAFCDLEHDGDQDVLCHLGGVYPGDAFPNALFLNPGHSSRFINIRLVGMLTNKSATGARIKVVVATPSGVREIHRAVGSVSSYGGSPVRQEIGLGKASTIKLIEVSWPKTGEKQSFSDVPLDSFIQITEGEAEYRTLEAKQFSLAAAPAATPAD